MKEHITHRPTISAKIFKEKNKNKKNGAVFVGDFYTERARCNERFPCMKRSVDVIMNIINNIALKQRKERRKTFFF